MKPTVKLSWFDKAAMAVSPSWGAGRIKNKMAISMLSNDGFVIPGSRAKSMKGVTNRANSPDVDIIGKLDGARALSRGNFMSSPLAASIFRRLRTMNIGSGLELQSVPDREVLGLTKEQVREFGSAIEREFDLWANSTNSDFDGINTFGDNQALGYMNMLFNGDYFWMPVWRPAPEKDFPYELCIKLIDADLVRDPDLTTKIDAGNPDVMGGVEKKGGTVVAYWVWDTYPNDEINIKQGSCRRIPVFDDTGRQQIFHVFNPERIGQRRGIGLLANAGEQLTQLSRAAQAELMNYIISSYFTVFVKDMSGMNAMLQTTMTPEEQVTGTGSTGPNSEPVGEQNAWDANDLEMGVGNIVNLDEQKEITIANPDKADKNYPEFYKTNAIPVCASASVPFETVQMYYESTYTAARAAKNDSRVDTIVVRKLISRKMNLLAFAEQFQEALLRGRIQAPGFYDDYSKRAAWLRSYWVGSGRGTLNPLHEAKASVIELNSFLTTHEQEYIERHGGRWDASLSRREAEETLIEEAGLRNEPDPIELVGPDGQADEEEEKPDTEPGADIGSGDKKNE